jgi:hypothetical protein
MLSSIADQKYTMLALSFFLLLAFVMADLFAFQNGAYATLSQVLLTISKRLKIIIPITAVVAGALIYHLYFPEDPTKKLDTPFWKVGLITIPFYVLGLYIANRWIWQLPTQD